MNDTQRQAIAALEAALPFLAVADKLSERNDFEPDPVPGEGCPAACRTQDAYSHAMAALKLLKGDE